MCGIAGYAGNLSRDADSVVDGMLARIAHRGPDDRGTWVGNDVALGHVRLSIIDLSERGHQPFLTADGQGVLSYNGEVFNFRELRTELEREGVDFRSESDTEVVLYALHRWGPERAITKFNGMFAFAYYDRRDASLWLARDRMGIKPLYVARRDKSLVFASEIKALFAHPDVPCEADQHAIVNMLLHDRLEGRMTPYRGVESLIPGTLHRLQAGKESATTYFDVLRDVDPTRILANHGVDFSSHLDRFEAMLRESVRMHLVSDAPLATMCSGGFDSSLVTAFAKEAKSDLVSYVADIEGMGGEEARRAKIVCDALKVELRVVDVTVDAYFRGVATAIQAYDRPLYFLQDVAAMQVAAAMNRDGIKAALSGDGADELFGGYWWQRRAFQRWRRRRIHARLVPDTPLSRLLGRFHSRLRPMDLAALAEDPSGPSDRGALSTHLARARLVDGARRHLREARLFRKLESLPRHEDRAFLARSFEDVYVHMREQLASIDSMTMRHSVELRVPILENSLIDFGLHLPVSAKFHRGTTKRIVKRLAERRLPREVVRLPKLGFNLPDSMWRGTADFLRGGSVAELLKWSAEDQADIIELVQRDRGCLHRLMSMETWLRMRFHGEQPEALSDELLRLRRAAT